MMKDLLKEKWYVIVYFTFLFLTFYFMLLACGSGEDYHFARYDQIPFEDLWYYEFSDGTSGRTSLPAFLDVNGDVDALVLRNTLPNVRDGMVFVYRSRHTDIKIYIDGKMVYDGLATAEGKVKNTVFPLAGNVWNEVTLSEEESAKEIVIESTCSVKKYLRGPGDVYLGERASFFLELTQSKMGTVLSAGVMSILALVLFVAWLSLRITTKGKYNELLCLALFTTSIALWGFTETRCLQYVAGNMRSYSVFAYEILPLAPVPIAMYFTYGKRKETVRLARIAAIIPLVLWTVNNMVHFLGICDLALTLTGTQIMLVFEVLFIGGIQINDIIKDSKTNGADSGGIFWRVPLVGLAVMLPLVLWDLIKYLFADVYFADKADGTCFGITAYILSLACHSALKLASENFTIAAASEAKSQFLANMSHEIRTPLNAILGFDELILRDATDEKILEYATSIQNAGASLRDIINTILDLSKIESGKVEIVDVEYNAVQLIDNVASIASALAVKKNLYVKVDVDERLPERFYGDEVHIRQVLVNLITNAVKYTYEGGVTFQVELLQESDENDVCQVRYIVKDTGVGIREEDKEKLFEKFERLDKDVNRNTEGTGLGMSIVAKLLEAMGSKVEFNSVYRVGSEFYFTLKQKVVDDCRVGVYEEEKERIGVGEAKYEAFVAPDAHILVVDDVQMNLQVACGLLADLKVQVDVADSGERAIEMAKKQHYDVILMDHMMPGMDGITATKEIREIAQQTGDDYYVTAPILALTANALSGMREMYLEAGMQDFISKPVQGKSLAMTLKKWIPEEKIIYDSVDKEIMVQKEILEESDSEWNIVIEGLQVPQARVYFTKAEMYIDTLRTFFAAIPDTIEKIENYTENRAVQDYIITVHGLKSSSKIIGAMELSEAAGALEQQAQEGRLDEVWEKTPHLLELYRTCQEAIRMYFGAEELVKKTLSREEMVGLLVRLQKCAEDFDMGALLDWEKETANDEVDEKYRDIWIQIREAVRNVAFSEITDILDESMKKL